MPLLSIYENKYVIGYGPNDIRELGDSKAYKSTTNDYYSVLELFATFNKAFDKHYVTGILGFNQEYNRWNWYKAEREGIISYSPTSWLPSEPYEARTFNWLTVERKDSKNGSLSTNIM